MAIRFRFVRHKIPTSNPFWHYGIQFKWKRYFNPPWATIYHLLELFILLFFYFKIIEPTVYYYFMHRQVFVESFYYDTEDDESAISTIDYVTDYFDTLYDNFYNILNNSFLNISLTPRSEDILCEIDWINGTKTIGPIPDDLDLGFFTHITNIKLSLDLRTISNAKATTGCTRWLIETNFFSKKGLSFFAAKSSTKSQHCNLSVFYDGFSHHSFEGFPLQKVPNKQFKKINRQKPLQRNKKKQTKKTNFFKKPSNGVVAKGKREHLHLAVDSDIPLFSKYDIQMYRFTYWFSLELIILSILHFILLLIKLYQCFKTHQQMVKSTPEYRHLNTKDQYHFSIGYWRTIDLISTIFTISSSIYLFSDSLVMTQFPSQVSIEFISVTTFFSFVRLNQWFGSYLPFYQLIVILREAAMRLVYLVIGILPIVTGLSLFGIFTFGFIDDSFETFRYLVQRMITSGMGDSIDDFFIIIDDGTNRVAWLGFFYVGVITAAGMWIVFTSCIATVAYIHQVHIVSRDSYWESSYDTESESEIE